MQVVDRLQDALDPDKTPIEWIYKARGPAEDKWTDNTDPWNTETDALDEFLAATANPDLEHPDTPTENALSSHAVAGHLALAKISLLKGDHAMAHHHLDLAMQHYPQCHSALCAAVAD